MTEERQIQDVGGGGWGSLQANSNTWPAGGVDQAGPELGEESSREHR